MHAIALTPLDLILAAILVLVLAGLSFQLRLALEWQIIVAAVRTTLQLLLIGVVLQALFDNVHLVWIILLAAIMLLVSTIEVVARQHRRFKGWWGYASGALSMIITSFSITVLTLITIIGVDPWYTPRYAVPLLGMVLGNTMTGIALSMDNLTQAAWQQRDIIEQRLLLGEDCNQAIADIRKNSIRVGMIPMINAMAVAGIVSLPGMMTGQILAGELPIEAVKYQILVMFLIAAGTGYGVMIAVWFSSHRLFDERERLRLDYLQ